MSNIGQISNLESGSSIRSKLNLAITEANKVDSKLDSSYFNVTGVLGYTPIADDYLGFGGVVKIDDNTIHHYVRIGSDHVGGPGDIYRIVYTVDTDTWSNEELIYTNPGYDSRNMLVGKIGTTIFLFFCHYDYGASAFVNYGYIKSTNNGATWSAFTVLYTTIPSGYFCGGSYGEICQTSSATTFLVPTYWYDTTNNLSKFGYYKTTNSGSTFTEVIIGTSTWTDYVAEPSLVYIGKSRIVCIVRRNSGGSYLWYSHNNGTSWTEKGQIPFCISEAATVAAIHYDYNTNKIVGQWLDRNVNKLYTAIGDADDIYYSLYGFKDIRLSDRDMNEAKNGYASFVNLETISGENANTILCVYSRQMTSSSAVLYYYKIKVY